MNMDRLLFSEFDKNYKLYYAICKLNQAVCLISLFPGGFIVYI